MSHFTVVKTKLIDRQALVKALNDLGFKNIELHDAAQHLYGYRGDQRAQTAEVIIRRKYIGRASNDIGFKLSQDGTYTAVISEYDRSKYGQEWLNRLSQRYAYHIARSKLTEQGFDLVSEETEQDGRIHLVLRRAG